MTHARFLSALAVVVGLVVAPLSSADAAWSRAISHAEVASKPVVASSVSRLPPQTISAPERVTVELVPGASGVIRPGEDLSLSVTISNRTSSELAPTIARVYFGRSDIRDHAELARWLDTAVSATAPATGVVIAELPTPPVGAGQAVVLPPILISAANVPIDDATNFGAHQIEVRFGIGADGAVAGSRSTITIDPGTSQPTASVSWVMPLTVPRQTAGLIPADDLAALTAPSGMLTRELEQTRGRPIALAIDPLIIVSIRALGDSAPATATAFLVGLEAVTNVTFPLSYADSDVAATVQAGAGLLGPIPFTLDPSLFSATPTPTPSTAPDVTPGPSPGVDSTPVPSLDALLSFNYSRTDIIWPREMSVIGSDLDVFSGSGLTTTMLASTNLDVPSGDSAPSPRAQIGTHTALISDSPASALFREAVTATTTPQWDSAIARLTGELASIADEGQPDGGPQLLLASLDRESAGGALRLGDTLDAIGQHPWSSGALLPSALSSPPFSATLVDSPTPAARLITLQSMLAAEGQTTRFASVLADPTLLTGPRRLALLALTSGSWVGSDAQWATAVTEFLKRDGDLLSSVRVNTSGSITVLADNGNLPISVSNVLDFPVTVYVEVTSPRIILSVRKPRVAVTVEAHSQKRASIPVQSIANGEVTISIALTSPSGVAVGTSTSAAVSVRAGWETAATTALGVLVGLIFVVGIIRTIRRRRAARRARSMAAETSGLAQSTGNSDG